MSFLDSIGNFFSNEKSHIGNLLSSWGSSPGKTLEQFALGAQDPLGAKLWSGVTGQKFTPSVGQLGGETNAQFSQSKSQGVNTGTSQTLGAIANVVAAAWGGSAAGGALGGLFGGAEGGAAAGAGEGLGEGAAATGGGGAAAGAGGADAAGLAAADSAAVSSEGAAAGLTESGGAAAGTSSGAGSSAWVKYGESAAKALAPTVLSSVLSPKPPKTKAPTAMPDPLAQQQAQRQKIIDQMARRGRASTILTNPGNAGGSLGG